MKFRLVVVVSVVIVIATVGYYVLHQLHPRQLVNISWPKNSTCKLIEPSDVVVTENSVTTNLPFGRTDLIFQCEDKKYKVGITITNPEQYSFFINPPADGEPVL